MLKFIRTNKSLTLVFASTILTGAIAVPSFSSLAVHVMNLILLLVMRHEAKDANNYKVTSILTLISIGLTAVMTPFFAELVCVQIVNAIVLFIIAYMAGKGE